MEELEFTTLIKCGNSRRKVEDLLLQIKDIKCQEENNWIYRVVCIGPITEDKILEGNSAFDCIVLGMSFLRQALRSYVIANPKIKFFEEADDELEEITIEDIFWTHDCITDEMEEMMGWAVDNGYKPE